MAIIGQRPNFSRLGRGSKKNNFCMPIGQDLQKNIAPTEKHFSDYLKVPNTDTFSILSTTPKEISELIKTLTNSKSLEPNSIPTNQSCHPPGNSWKF